MYPNRSHLLALLVALVAALAAATPAAAVEVTPTASATPTPAATPAPVPEGVDVADYGRAFGYWQVEGLDPVKCPQGPIAVYDEARIQSFTVPVTDASGAVQHVHAIAFVQSNDPCRWWFGDVYRAMDRVHRCHVITHELGHLLGRPDGLGALGDTLGVMGQFAITPQCAEVQPPEVREADAAAQATVEQADPMAVAALAGRAREVADMNALADRWARYDRAVERRARFVERRDRCLRTAAEAKTPRGRRRASNRCRARVRIPRMPARPSLTRPY